MERLKQLILANYNSSDPKKRKIALDAGKEYLKKYGECACVNEFVDWLKSAVPKWERSIV